MLLTQVLDATVDEDGDGVYQYPPDSDGHQPEDMSRKNLSHKTQSQSSHITVATTALISDAVSSAAGSLNGDHSLLRGSYYEVGSDYRGESAHSNNSESPISETIDEQRPQTPTSNNSSVNNTHPPATISNEHVLSIKQQLISRVGPNRWTPLMVACVKAPPSVISLLVKVCPKACSIPDKTGSLPLHFVSCWRRTQVEASGDSKKESEEDEDMQQQRYDAPPSDDELCLVLYILLTAYPDALAKVNRWGQTPLHSLFESKHAQYSSKPSHIGGMGEWKRSGLCMVETLLGMWDPNMCDKFHSYTCLKDAEEVSGVKELAQNAVYRSLRTRDGKGRLPLHTAADSKWVDESMLRAVVAGFPRSTWIPVVPPFQGQGFATRSTGTSFSWDLANNVVTPEEDADVEETAAGDGLFPQTGGCYGRDLAVHILHRKFLLPLATAQAGSIDEYDDEEESFVKSAMTDASVFLGENHCSAISAVLEPIVEATNCNSGDGMTKSLEARVACSATGTAQNSLGESNSALHTSMHSLHSSTVSVLATLLPIHIASMHGASYEILQGLCHAYPEGVCTPMTSPIHTDRLNALAVELFEEGRAGREVNVACDTTFPRLMTEYFRRSDLLWSYHPEAISRKKVLYCKDEARLRRFENLIRDDVTKADGILSDIAGSAWFFFCCGRDAGSSKSRRGIPSFGASIGRILDGLPSRLVQKLYVVRTTSAPEGVRVPPLAYSGRTVVEEAKHRAPQGSFGRTLDHNFFHSSVLSFLSACDALAYSSVSRKARARGVRLLNEVSCIDEANVTTLDFQEDDCLDEDEMDSGDIHLATQLLPWKKMEFPFEKSTHTLFVSFEANYRHVKEGNRIDGEGGLFIVNDNKTVDLDSADMENSDAIVAFIPISSQDGKMEIRVAFSHSAGCTYTMWYFGKRNHTLTLSGMDIRQLVYGSDYNGYTPLLTLLSEGDNPSNLTDLVSILVGAGFGSPRTGRCVGDLPLHFALKVGVLERTLRSLIDSAPSSLLDTDSDGQTALHFVFQQMALPSSDSEDNRMPYLGIVQALLAPPGENATHVKDSKGRLPLHIAAERGAGEAILRVLVEACADSCYRRTSKLYPADGSSVHSILSR